jgi:hypothetical protein
VIVEPVRGIPCRRLNACPVPFPDFVNGGGGAVARQLLSIRIPPGGVTGHHPYRRFTRVITAGLLSPRRTGMGLAGGESPGGLTQAELARAGDRRGAVLNGQFAVQSALVCLHGVQ